MTLRRDPGAGRRTEGVLPPAVRTKAKKSYRLFVADPASVKFKAIKRLAGGSQACSARVTHSPEDLREVGNYVAALEHGVERLKTLLLAANPFITVRKAEGQLDVAYKTASAALRRLVRLKTIKQVGEARRERFFYAEALLDILEEPARLRPE